MDLAISNEIEAICRQYPYYGCRCVTHELRHRRLVVNDKKVMRIMRVKGLAAKRKRLFVVTTDSTHGLPVFPNLYRTLYRPNRTRCGWPTSRPVGLSSEREG